MKSQAAAAREGYDVDLSGPGRPMGARGNYPHYEVIPLLTEMESELLHTLGLIRSLLAEGSPGTEAREAIVQAIDGVLTQANA